jgi:biotin transport system substrate-specific component
VGWAAERGWTRRVVTTLIALLVSEALIYVFGLAWLSRFSLPVGLLDAGLIPFIAGDLCVYTHKIGVAITLLPPATRALARRAPKPAAH